MSYCHLPASVVFLLYFSGGGPCLPKVVSWLNFLQNHYRDRSLTARGRNQAPVRSPRSNGRIVISQEKSLPERKSRDHELSQAQFHINQSAGKFGYSDLHHTGSPESKLCSNVNSSTHLSERMVEFGSVGHPAYCVSSTEGGRQPNPDSAPAHNFSVSQATPGMQGPKSVSAINQDR